VQSSCECGNEPSGFHNMLGNYRVAAQAVASRVVLSSIQLLISQSLVSLGLIGGVIHVPLCKGRQMSTRNIPGSKGRPAGA
jgi:hypothetical protein